jgi:hypothetical protein
MWLKKRLPAIKKGRSPPWHVVFKDEASFSWCRQHLPSSPRSPRGYHPANRRPLVRQPVDNH